MAMGIGLEANRLDLEGDRLFLEDRGIVPGSVVWSSRVGIRVGTEQQWRAYVDRHPSVSARGGRASTARRARP